MLTKKGRDAGCVEIHKYPADLLTNYDDSAISGQIETRLFQSDEVNVRQVLIAAAADIADNAVIVS